MHGRHFTFKSIISHAAVTIVAPSVAGALVSKEMPYVIRGRWLQVLISEELAERMAEELQILNTPNQVIKLYRSLSSRSILTPSCSPLVSERVPKDFKILFDDIVGRQ